jgi:Uma2 family endonuclease
LDLGVMNAPLKRRMKVPEFLEWGEVQEKGRYELVDGTVVAMSPERVGHVRAKQAAWLALSNAINAAKLPCEALGDGVTVVIDKHTAREPDALVQCDKPLDPDSLVSDSPVIVVEVLSPSSERSDTGEKLAEYFRVPSVRHYLIVNPFRRLVIHHARGKSSKIDTRIVESGLLELSPPGLSVPVESLFG